MKQLPLLLGSIVLILAGLAIGFLSYYPAKEIIPEGDPTMAGLVFLPLACLPIGIGLLLLLNWLKGRKK